MTITLDRVTTIHPPGEVPSYSHWGYIIPADGTIYALSYQWYHGVVLALLYPDKLKAHRSDRCPNELIIPDDREDINVFDFQDFELSQHGELPAIRICPSRVGEPSFDFPKHGCTKVQVEALRLTIKALGLTARDKIATDHRDMRVCDIWGSILMLDESATEDLTALAEDILAPDPDDGWPAVSTSGYYDAAKADENDVPDEDDAEVAHFDEDEDDEF